MLVFFCLNGKDAVISAENNYKIKLFLVVLYHGGQTFYQHLRFHKAAVQVSFTIHCRPVVMYRDIL